MGGGERFYLTSNEQKPTWNLLFGYFIALLTELFNNHDFGLPSRQHKKDWVFLIAVQASFPKELDFLPIPRPDCLPRNAHSFYNP